mmetsp:Transcript_232/g.813  ORF Transcript_232/g.813 Transcript_232/m.813 type:complete len:203 (-) Transcript_232:387-995(-)
MIVQIRCFENSETSPSRQSKCLTYRVPSPGYRANIGGSHSTPSLSSGTNLAKWLTRELMRSCASRAAAGSDPCSQTAERSPRWFGECRPVPMCAALSLPEDHHSRTMRCKASASAPRKNPSTTPQPLLHRPSVSVAACEESVAAGERPSQPWPACTSHTARGAGPAFGCLHSSTPSHSSSQNSSMSAAANSPAYFFCSSANV